MFALSFALTACHDTLDDISFEWADKVHAMSPSHECVAFVMEEKTGSAVQIVFQNGCAAIAASFRGTSLRLKLQWHDPTTLEILCPKGLSPIPCRDAREAEIVSCHDIHVRVLLLEI